MGMVDPAQRAVDDHWKAEKMTLTYTNRIKKLTVGAAMTVVLGASAVMLPTSSANANDQVGDQWEQISKDAEGYAARAK
jgi:hypothetical protein